MTVAAVSAVTSAVNAAIIAVANEQRRKVLQQFQSRQALSPDNPLPRAQVESALHATLDQLRTQGIIKDVGSDTHYLDTQALLAYEKGVRTSQRKLARVIVPVFVAVAVAVVVAIVFSR